MKLALQLKVVHVLAGFWFVSKLLAQNTAMARAARQSLRYCFTGGGGTQGQVTPALIASFRDTTVHDGH